MLVNKEDSKTRLDIFLLLNHSDLSRNFIANAIKKGMATINGAVELKPSTKVKENDEITFNVGQAKTEINEIDFENVIPRKMNLDIVFEDDDLLVINKPSGVPTHPSHGYLDNTLLNGVHYYLHEDGNVLPLRKHMVHRLDKDTSGLILFAKTDKMLWWLHKQFAERNMEKHYFALSLASKKYNANEDIELKGYIERSKRETRLYMFSTKYGRWTHTNFKVLRRFTLNYRGALQNLVLLDCKPKTGRTHQIRVHLKHLNLPIFADPLYSSDKQLKLANNYCSDKHVDFRLFLQAYKLIFKSYTGKEYNLEIPLNKDLESIISSLNEI